MDKEKDYLKFKEICEKRLNLANESYFLLENEIKRVNFLLEKTEFECSNLKANNFSYKNYILEKNEEEMKDLELFISKKRGRNQKSVKTSNNKIIIRNEDYKSEEVYKSKLGINSDEWEDITYQELDGKIRNKEPIYCFCNYISYGNMIKCDNTSCKRVWFHFHCVGLKNLPKGKWFCSTKCFEEYESKFKFKNKFKV